MKRIIEINYGTSITVNRGNYENFKPMWHQKTMLEVDGKLTDEEINKLESEEFTRIKAKLDKFAEEEWNKQKVSLAGIRIRIKEGKQYPSVTSIINQNPYDFDPEYGIRGKEIERIVRGFIRSNTWDVPREVLTKLDYTSIKYQEFFETFKDRIKWTKLSLNPIEVFNLEHAYSGEIDLIATIDGKPTIVDIKTGSWSWEQLIAYYKCSNKDNEYQLGIFDLKKQELKLLDPKEAVKYWEKFLIKRGEFKSRFGI